KGVPGGQWDLMVARFNGNGTLAWGFYYGAFNAMESAASIAVKNDQILVTGDVVGSAPNYIVSTPLQNAFQNTFAGMWDALCMIFCDSQLSSIAGNNVICPGNTTQTYSVSPAYGAVNYTWTLPGGWTGSSSTNTISLNPISNGIL